MTGARVERATDRPPQRGQSVVELALILPVLAIILLGIADLARVYSALMTLESAAREAADYGTHRPWLLDPNPPAYSNLGTVAEMERRACVASKALTDYAGPDEDCANPSFSYVIDPAPAGVSVAGCAAVPRSATPCNVTVTLTFDFDLIFPSGLLGLPSTVALQRSSTFAVSDFEIDTGP